MTPSSFRCCSASLPWFPAAPGVRRCARPWTICSGTFPRRSRNSMPPHQPSWWLLGLLRRVSRRVDVANRVLVCVEVPVQARRLVDLPEEAVLGQESPEFGIEVSCLGVVEAGLGVEDVAGEGEAVGGVGQLGGEAEVAPGIEVVVRDGRGRRRSVRLTTEREAVEGEVTSAFVGAGEADEAIGAVVVLGLLQAGRVVLGQQRRLVVDVLPEALFADLLGFVGLRSRTGSGPGSKSPGRPRPACRAGRSGSRW